jgi:hypothetical protein
MKKIAVVLILFQLMGCTQQPSLNKLVDNEAQKEAPGNENENTQGVETQGDNTQAPKTSFMGYIGEHYVISAISAIAFVVGVCLFCNYCCGKKKEITKGGKSSSGSKTTEKTEQEKQDEADKDTIADGMVNYITNEDKDLAGPIQVGITQSLKDFIVGFILSKPEGNPLTLLSLSREKIGNAFKGITEPLDEARTKDPTMDTEKEITTKEGEENSVLAGLTKQIDDTKAILVREQTEENKNNTIKAVLDLIYYRHMRTIYIANNPKKVE